MISYKPLLHLLVEKDMNLYELEKAGISTNVVSKFKKGEHVNTSTLEKLCIFLDCRVQDIIEITKD